MVFLDWEEDQGEGKGILASSSYAEALKWLSGRQDRQQFG